MSFLWGRGGCRYTSVLILFTSYPTSLSCWIPGFLILIIYLLSCIFYMPNLPKQALDLDTFRRFPTV